MQYILGEQGIVGGNNPETMLESRMALQQTQGIQAHYGPLTAQIFQHFLNACTHTGVQTNTAKYKGAQPHTLVQVPHKTLLGMKEHSHGQMHRCVCITIPQTLTGKQTLFVVHSTNLYLTALKALSNVLLCPNNI